MSKESVTIDRIEAYNGRSAKGRAYTRWTLYATNGEKYSLGFDKPSPDATTGADVTLDITVTPEGYRNAKIVSVDAAGTGTPPSTATSSSATSGGSARSRYRQNGEAGGFPVHPRAYERTLDRRNALNAAVALVQARSSVIGSLTGAQAKELVKTLLDPAAIVEIATVFESYSCGDIERMAMKERAEKKKAEEAAKEAARKAAEEEAAARAEAEADDAADADDDFDDDTPF